MQQKRVYNMFDEKFNGNKKVPIALYGLGINTKYLLDKAKDNNIIGIVANDRIGEYIYGKKIMSIEDIEDKVKIIVIVAQMKSVKIIYNRIKYVESKGVDIYDIWGEKVGNIVGDEQGIVQNNPYWDSTFDKLRNEIDKHDIVSFDVFDTLIMRRVLKQDNIWSIMEEELKEKCDNIAFKIERMKAEHQLLEKGIIPTIEDIYNILRINIGIDEKVSHWLIEKEIEIEKKYAIKRQCMVDALKYASIRGKEIYLIVDSHLSSKQIYELILKCSITSININNIIVSSDIKKTKRDGSLFEFFIHYAGKGSKLHIGSNNKIDIEMAEKLGIDTYFVMSAYEMFLKSSVSEVILNATSIDDYIVLGLFAAKAFNSPFALSESKGKLQIGNMYDLGYYCFAPITLKFLTWSFDRLKNDDNSIVLFSSRDGYLIYQLYHNLQKKNVHLNIPKGIYFYISRRSVTVANILTADDIVSIVEDVLKLSIGNFKEILEQRLGIEFDKNDSMLNRSLIDVLGQKDKNQIVTRVLEYKDSILKNASLERKHYLEYIQRNNLETYEKIYLFDLYTKGTSLRKLSKLINKELELLCYAVKDFPNECISTMNNVKSLFDNIEFLHQRWFERSYQLFEVIYSSKEGQLKCFDNNGMPQFVENSEYNYSYIKAAQAGIVDFINDFEIIDGNYYISNINLKMVDSISKMMTQNQSVISDDVRNGFSYYDSFASESIINIWDRII